MRRLGPFRALAVFAGLPLAAYSQGLTRENGLWVRTCEGTAATAPRVQVMAHGPVVLSGGVSQQICYSIKSYVKARTEAIASRLLGPCTPGLQRRGAWLIISAPRSVAASRVFVRTPKIEGAAVSTSDGDVEVTGVDGPVDVGSLGGELKADRVSGDCKLVTGGGDIWVGEVRGSVHCSTEAGNLSLRAVGGWALLQTGGGNIVATTVGGAVTAQTAGGTLNIGSAGGPVDLVNGGGRILVGKAAGVVQVRNLAGPVEVSSAHGVKCESHNGGIQLSGITGAMEVSTAWGSILANLLGSRLADESSLATANGDITVLVPSNVGVRIRAENEMADSLRRIVSEFRELQPGREGMRIVAEGPLNGGGPLLQVSARAGTIFIKRQR